MKDTFTRDVIILEYLEKLFKNVVNISSIVDENDTNHADDLILSEIKKIRNRELTYEERIQWFVNNHYETGMEYEILLETMRNDDLDNVKWYDITVKIPKYFSQIYEKS